MDNENVIPQEESQQEAPGLDATVGEDDNADIPVEESSKGHRSSFIDRVRGSYPDVDFDNEDPELRYEAYNKYADDIEGKLKQYKDSDKTISDLFEKDPRMARVMSAVAGGGDAATEFARNYGSDFAEAANDPDRAKEIAEANMEFMGRIENLKNLQAEQDKNIASSQEAMSSFADEKKMDDAAFGEFISKVDDFVGRVISGDLSRDVLDMLYRAINYDKDLSEAAHTGLVEGRNEAIEEKLKASVGDGVPHVQGSGAGLSKEPKRAKNEEPYNPYKATKYKDVEKE